MKPYLSLIVIAYNSANYIEDCLNSVFSQTFKDFETIIINNNSTDNTNEKVTELIKGKPNIKYINNPKNIGGAAAGNLGIKKARGKYVFLMDSDDVLPQNALFALSSSAQKTNGDIVIGRAKCIYGDQIDYMRFNADDLTWAKTGEYSSLKKRPELAIAPFYWGRIIKRGMLLRHRIFMKNGRINADRYFTLKALKHSKKTVVIDDLCYLWRRFLETGDRVSVSRGNTEQAAFLDKMLSIYEADSLFRGFFNRNLRKIIKLQTVNRLLIYAKYTVQNADFRALYVESMKKYLSGVPLEDIYHCPYFSARRKTMCFLLMQDKIAEFCKIADPETKLENIKDGDTLDMIINIDGVPNEAKRQYRMHIAAFSVKQEEVVDDTLKITAVSKVWLRCNSKVLNLRLIKENGEEVCKLPCKSKKKNDKHFIKTEVACKALKAGENCKIVAEYLVNGLFNTCIFKKDKEIFFMSCQV